VPDTGGTPADDDVALDGSASKTVAASADADANSSCAAGAVVTGSVAFICKTGGVVAWCGDRDLRRGLLVEDAFVVGAWGSCGFASNMDFFAFLGVHTSPRLRFALSLAKEDAEAEGTRATNEGTSLDE